MPLTLLLGAAGTGKTWTCIDQMQAALAAEFGPLILLVPEQATHQTERLALDRLGPSHRYQVLSFRRLAWRVFQEAGGAARPPITDLGRKLVLRAILQRRSAELSYFGDLADRPGMLDHLSRALRECRSYELGPAELRKASDSWGGAGSGLVLPGKLRDLALIMTDLEGHLAGRYTDPDQALSRLAERLPAARLARGAQVWIDGFSGFTPQEYRVLGALLDSATAGVTVTLCLDSRGTYEAAGLFSPTLDTRERLTLLASEGGHAVAERGLASGHRIPPRFARAPGIAHLEQAFFAPGPDVLAGSAPDVALIRAPDARAESAQIAREILRLCREEGFRMRDVAVVVRDPDTYHPALGAAFAEHGIPAFVDERRGVSYHALVELLRSAVETVAEDWPYEPLFRFLKTDLASPSREEVDRLENLALEYGLRGHARWIGDRWPGPAWLRELRDRAVGPLAAFHARVCGKRRVREICAALYGLLEELGVPGRLECWALDAEAAGDLAQAAEHLQVHDAILDLLDQLVEALGDSALPCRDFLPLLEAGLSGLQLGMVPPSLDQVVVGSVERSRHPELRAVFVAGASEGTFPRAEDEDLVFDDIEREALAARGAPLGPTSQERLLSEPFALYLALTRAGERLYLCHSQADATGREVAPSVLWARARDLVPGCRFLDGAAPPVGLEAVATIGQLAERVAARSGAGGDWARLHDWLLAAPERHEAARFALGAPGWSNAADPLPPDLAAALYGDALTVSPSRLENMAACPFKHFARHGLGLTPRPVFRVEPVDIGRFLHGALERFIGALGNDGADLGQLDQAERERRIAAAAAEILAQGDDSALQASGQARHLMTKLVRALGGAAGALSEHARRGRFRPVAVELPFGPEGKVPGITLAVRGDRRVEVRGRIDRLDAASAEGGDFLLVIDYKRSGLDLSIEEVGHGLALQMALYLVVATREGAGLVGLQADASGAIRPGGMLYVPVQPTWRTFADAPDAQEAADGALKAYKARGLLNLEAAQRGMFDSAIGYSPVVPLRMDKDGAIVESQSRVARADQLAALMDHVLGAASRLGEAILDGHIDLAPFRLKDATPCGHCDYRPVCRFDPDLGDAYRDLPPLGRDGAWEAVGGAVPPGGA